MTSLVETIIILIISFNVRYLNTTDGLNSWDNRKEAVLNIIQSYSPDLLGLQEVRGKQLEYLIEKLKDYNHVGRSRSEDESDEQTPIFFNSGKFELLDTDTFWLSETPSKIGRGWDAALNRIVTWVKLKDKETGKILFHFNTHFDHAGSVARMESVKLLKRKIADIAGEEDYVVTGDFNFDPATDHYKLLTTKDSTSAGLNDAAAISSNPVNNSGTFNNFNSDAEPTGPIDYILVKPGIPVNGYEVINTTYNGILPSDHYPVKAAVQLIAK